MAFKGRNEKTEIETKKEEIPIFETYKDEIIYVLKYLKTEHGIDFTDPNRKPGMHIRKDNNPFFVGGVGETKNNPNVTEEIKNNNLINFFKKS